MALDMPRADLDSLINELIKEGKRGQEVAQKIRRAVSVTRTPAAQVIGGSTAIRQPILTDEEN